MLKFKTPRGIVHVPLHAVTGVLELPDGAGVVKTLGDSYSVTKIKPVLTALAELEAMDPDRRSLFEKVFG